MKKRYWMCIIGPTDQKKLPSGADNPMRNVVETKFLELTGHENKMCASGWGLTEEKMNEIQKVWNDVSGPKKEKR